MLDAVAFEERGLPAVAVLTQPFRATGLAIAELQGFADYPFLTVPHPITSLTLEETYAVADAVTPHVEAMLLGRALTIDPANASTADDDALGALVDKLAPSFRADGGDLSADQVERLVTFTLHIPTEACAECIMPSSVLLPMFQQRVEAALGPGHLVKIVDPRT